MDKKKTVSNLLENMEIDIKNSPTLILKAHWSEIIKKLDEGARLSDIFKVIEKGYELEERSYNSWHQAYIKIKKNKSNTLNQSSNNTKEKKISNSNKKSKKTDKIKLDTYSPGVNEENPLLASLSYSERKEYEKKLKELKKSEGKK